MSTSKVHTTNYINAFIEVAEDCPVNESEIPVEKNGKATVASTQYQQLHKNAYKWTSDDVIFSNYVLKNELTESELADARALFFSKGQPCLRTSPLAKRYGFGIHSDSEGKVAIYGVESKEYQQFMEDDSIKKVKAMRSSKK